MWAKKEGRIISDEDDAHVMQNDMKYRNVSRSKFMECNKKSHTQTKNELQNDASKKNLTEHTSDYRTQNEMEEKERGKSTRVRKRFSQNE